MNGYVKPSSWLLALAIVQLVKSQMGEELKYKEEISTFEIRDGEKLFLDEDSCLRSITVKAYLTNETFDSEIKPSMRLDIIWESDHNLTSLDVQSDSFNDSYCDANDRFRYQRKPMKKHMHTFPDTVNNGARFLPIKLDCKYIIVPEMPYPCSPIMLKYTTPVCLSENVCSCRNASLPTPDLAVENNSGGVFIHWRAGEDGNVDDITMIRISVELAQVPLPFNPEQALAKEFSTSVWENAKTRSGKHYFQLSPALTRKYIVRALYENFFACYGNISQIYFHFPETEGGTGRSSIEYTIFYVIVVLILTMIATLLFWRKKNFFTCRKAPRDEGGSQIRTADNNENIRPPLEFRNLVSVNNPIYSPVQDDEYVVDYKQLKIKKKLSEGHFGIVYLASSSVEIKGLTLFAVKQLRDGATKVDVEDFYKEIHTFIKAGSHPNVMTIIGYCENPLSIIMEYMPYDLLRYLTKLRDEFQSNKSKLKKCAENGDLPVNYITANEVENAPLRDADKEELEVAIDSQELESFALQIARGMAHLEQMDIVHRDLAARNVLMDHSKGLKITDFGMSRSGIYVTKPNRKFPLRWMSPESVRSLTFSTKSDVWSFAVVLWEIGTLGGVPYSNLRNDEVMALLNKGGHPGKPENVTEALYDVMLSCWNSVPDDRPSFGEIVKKIENLRTRAYVEFEDLKVPADG